MRMNEDAVGRYCIVLFFFILLMRYPSFWCVRLCMVISGYRTFIVSYLTFRIAGKSLEQDDYLRCTRTPLSGMSFFHFSSSSS